MVGSEKHGAREAGFGNNKAATCQSEGPEQLSKPRPTKSDRDRGVQKRRSEKVTGGLVTRPAASGNLSNGA